MRVYQVLNNNVVTSLDDGKEVIVIGTGIGFQKKPEDDIDESKIQSKFYPANNTLTQQMIHLMEETPEEIIDIVVEIVRQTEKEIDASLNNGIYLTLTDHISFALDRYKKGLEIKNVLLWDIKKLYQKEFEIGQRAVSLINERLDVELTDDEAAFIAVHIMNAEFNVGIDMMDSMTKIINEVIKIIEYYFGIEFDQDSLAYLRLINHLKFFAQRVLSDAPYKDDESILLDVVKQNYVEPFKCASRIKEFIRLQYNCEISDEELTYLSIHIQRLIDTKT